MLSFYREYAALAEPDQETRAIVQTPIAQCSSQRSWSPPWPHHVILL